MENMAKVSTITAGSITFGVVHRGPTLGQGRRHSSSARNVFSCVRTRRRNLPSSERVWVCRVLRVHGPHSPTTRLDSSRKALTGSHGGQHGVSRKPPLSAGQSGIVHKRARDIGAPAHLGHSYQLHTAHQSNDPRWSHSWRSAEATLGNSLGRSHRNSHPLPPPSALLMTRTATATLYDQKAAQAAEEPWQQTTGGSARTQRHKPDSISPRTSQLRFSGRRQRGYGLLSILEEPTQCAAAPSAAFTAN